MEAVIPAERPALSTHDNLMWLVGLIEGEGSFLRSPPSRPNEPRIEIEMKDRVVIERAGALMGATTQTRVRREFDPPKVIYRVRLSGKKAVQLMLALRPYLCDRRQAQIDRALAGYTGRTPAIALDAAIPLALVALCPTPMCPAPAGMCAAHDFSTPTQET